jgi:HSP20 family protein
MNSIRNIKLRWLHGTLGDVSYQLSRVQFSRVAPAKWQPAINAFRCETAIRICVDLAGIEKSKIDLTVEPRQVIIRGTREVPEPNHGEGRALQLLALEIDYGPFEREVSLPAEVDADRASAEQENGLLWIYLPLKK